MAVQAYLANYVDASGKKDPLIGRGVQTIKFQVSIAIAAADDDGSTFLVCKDIPAEAILHKLDVESSGITAGTSYSFGIYDSEAGTAIAANAYANAVDMSSASTKVAPKDGLAALTHAASAQRVFEVAGHNSSTKKPQYDLVMTANTIGTAAGTITVRGEILVGG